MSVNCPKCSAELTDFVHTDTLKERVGQLTEKNRVLSENLRKVEGLAKQAAPLAAKAHGYEFDSDSLEMLQSRYEKSQKTGYEGDFASWLGDSEGAGRDSVASRFRVTTPAAPAAAARQTQEEAPPATTAPAAPPPARLPSTPTATVAPPVVRMTEQQVAALNEKLLAEYRTAPAERRPQIKAEIEKNRAQLGSAG